MDVEIIFDHLQDEDLIDSRGQLSRHRSADEQLRFNLKLTGQAVKYTTSEFSGNDIPCYFINVNCFDQSSVENSARYLEENFRFDDNIFIGIAGEDWAIAVGKGAVDANVPLDLAKRLLDVLPLAEVVWEDETPTATWFTPRFNTSADIAQALLQLGYDLDPLIPAGENGLQYVQPYIKQLCLKGHFQEVIINGVRESKSVSVIAQLWIEPLLADDLEMMVDAYFGDDGRDDALAIGAGWCVRLISRADASLNYRELQVFAFDLETKLAPEETDAAFAAQKQWDIYINNQKPKTTSDE